MIENELLASVSDMDLDWCKVVLIESEWVSDYYLAFVRIIKWFYHPLESLNVEEDYSEPNKDVKLWLLLDCNNWVKVRGLDTTNKVNDLETRVAYYKNTKDRPPPILCHQKCSVKELNVLIESLLLCVSNVMIRQVGINYLIELDRDIKLFLSSIHIVQESLKLEGNTKDLNIGNPYWLSKYNYTCLLNLPVTMKYYGPLINLWEGSNQGEGFFRYVEPQIRDVFTKSW